MSTLLLPNTYVHILNNDSGEVRTEIGPKRISLASNEEQIGDVKQSLIVNEDEYVVIKNPYDPQSKSYKFGQQEVRTGPCVLSLYYNERADKPIKVHVLSKSQALRVRAIAEHDNKQAGSVWQIVGETRFIPNKFTEVLKPIEAIRINDNEGIYVKNVETSEKRLIKGPTSYLLEANEELYNKPYTDMEKAALGLKANDSYEATVVRLVKGEVMCILDAEKNEHIHLGPKSVILQPEEHVKVLWLSAGKPKKPKQIKAAKVRLGPDFMSDKFEVRTKDNAALTLLLTYKWEFLVDEKEAYKVFSLPDFIGYSCTTLCSKIREEAAKYTFEEFHSKTVGIIRGCLFKDHEVVVNNQKQAVHGLYFDEIKFLVSEVDVKDVTPVSDEINNLLNQSIKSNMIIVCNKMEQEANLKSQKEKIKTSADIQKLRQTLIDIQNENLSLEKVERAKIEGQVKILEAKSKKESDELKTTATDSVQLEKMQKTIELLNTETGLKYLELLRAQNFAKIKQSWFVSSDDKLNGLPLPHAAK